MNYQDQQGVLIMEIPQISSYKVQLQQEKLSDKYTGPLKIFEIQQQNLHVMEFNDKKIILYKQLPIYVSEFDECRTYLFYNEETNFFIRINNTDTKYQILLEEVLSELVTLIYNTEDYTQQQIEKNQQKQIRIDSVDIQEQEKKFPMITTEYQAQNNQINNDQNRVKNESQTQIDNSDSSSLEKQDIVNEIKIEAEVPDKNSNQTYKFSKYFRAGEDFIGKSIKAGQKLSQQAIVATATMMLPKDESQKQNIHVSEKTKKRAKLISKASGTLMKISSSLAQKLQDKQIDLTRRAYKKLNKNKKSEQSENPKLQMIQQIFRESLASVMSIILQLETSTNIIAKEFGQNYKNVIKERYGEDLAELTDIIFESADHIQNIYTGLAYKGSKGLLLRQAKLSARVLGE